MWYFINRFFKRFFDILLSLLALIILSPFFLIIAIAIKANSKGPVFFKQERRTKNGRVFKMYKFRSMVVNAESMGAGLFNYENDPRVTKVGRFLRKTSLDELPQLWYNVLLRGNMSLVGPRPVLREELDRYYTDEEQQAILSVKPGVTGYWQAYARNRACYENGERQQMELYYAENHSFWLDLKIMLRTVIAVISKAGAK